MSSALDLSAADADWLEERLGYPRGDISSGRVRVVDIQVRDDRCRLVVDDPDEGHIGLDGLWKDTGETTQPRQPASLATASDNNSARGCCHQGLTQQEFAALARVDHRTITQHVVEIPTGPAPSLPPGKIPARLIGKVKRIFLIDIFGDNKNGGRDGSPVEKTDSDTTDRDDWRGPLGKLRQPRRPNR